MMKQTTCYSCDKPIEPEWLPEGEFIVCDECSLDTDKLSVEKLEPIGYYNEAHGFLHDEFDKDCYCQGGCSMEAVYTESQVKKLTGENKVEKLQEQLNTAKKALECIINSNDTAFGFVNSNLRRYVEDALAAIGGDDE
ncbi:hypothetical protein VN91_0871 [Lactococcus lactis subsp. lactis]|nr:hypothetical protein VN91_0871 [Lactococcus lactis subsp. lactis]